MMADPLRIYVISVISTTTITTTTEDGWYCSIVAVNVLVLVLLQFSAFVDAVV